MADYMLLLHTPPAGNRWSPEEMQNVIQRYAAWSKGLSASGRLVGGHKLRDAEGRVLKRHSNQTTVTDGPTPSSKRSWAAISTSPPTPTRMPWRSRRGVRISSSAARLKFAPSSGPPAADHDQRARRR